jgi:four helix bundle protein
MEGSNHLRLSQIGAYKISFELSNYVWEIVLGWDILARKTIGEQFIRSVDSISANIAEGFGRYFKKDKVHFYLYSRGSVYESLDWLQKAKTRKLLIDDQYNFILEKLKNLPREINSLIKFTNEKLTI